MEVENKIEKSIDQILVGVSIFLGSLSIGRLLFINFSFTEGWYSNWDPQYEKAITEGLPFPPVYHFLYSKAVGIANLINVDEYVLLRIIGLGLIISIWICLWRINYALFEDKASAWVGSAVGVSIFMSMEALVIYDYTPFLFLCICWSIALILEIKKSEANIVPGAPKLKIAWLVLLTIALAGSKQNYIVISFCILICSYILLEKRLRKVILILSFFSYTTYFVLVAAKISGQGLLELYTDASYKGGTSSIIGRIPLALINSARAINTTGVIKGFIAALVILPIILLLLKIKDLYREKMDQRYNEVFIKKTGSFTIMVVVSALALIGCYKIFSVTSTPITSIRAGGVFFLLTVFVISGGYIRDKEKTLEFMTVNGICAALIVINCMSGATGAMDSSIAITVFAGGLIGLKASKWDGSENELERKGIKVPKIFVSALDDWGNTIVKSTFGLIVMSLQLHAVIDMKKGYVWWGIKESDWWGRQERELENMRNIMPLKNKIPGRILMTQRQTNFVNNYVNIVKSLGKELPEGSIMSFPNIPYFIQAVNGKAYGNTPVAWIDVTSKRQSMKLLNKWDTEKPKLIVLQKHPDFTYKLQGEAFSPTVASNNAFLRIKEEIEYLILRKEYIHIDSYMPKNKSYGVFLLASKDIADDLIRAQKIDLKVLEDEKDKFGELSQGEKNEVFEWLELSEKSSISKGNDLISMGLKINNIGESCFPYLHCRTYMNRTRIGNMIGQWDQQGILKPMKSMTRYWKLVCRDDSNCDIASFKQKRATSSFAAGDVKAYEIDD